VSFLCKDLMSYRDSRRDRDDDSKKRPRDDDGHRRGSKWTDKEWDDWEKQQKDRRRDDRRGEDDRDSRRREHRREDRYERRRGEDRPARDRSRPREEGRSKRERSPDDSRRSERRSERSGRDERRRDHSLKRRNVSRSRERDSRRRHRSKSQETKSQQKPRTQAVVGGVVRNLRIDRHECRKAAIEFLIQNYDITDKHSNSEIEDMIRDHIRSLPMEYEYYSFTEEILRGLLIDRKYCVITDRWVMGILDEYLQAELRIPDLAILRVAGFELLTHPEIPTTVVINEVNVLSKMYCPEMQSLIHAAVNRMIETQISIGNEIAAESGERKKGKDDPMSLLIGLDQEAQLAVILLEQMRKKRKHDRRVRSSSRESSYSSAASSEGARSPKRSRPASPRHKDTEPIAPSQGIFLTYKPVNIDVGVR
jgi:transcription termination factor NusB